MRDIDVQRFLDSALRKPSGEVVEFSATAGEWVALFREVFAARRRVMPAMDVGRRAHGLRERLGE